MPSLIKSANARTISEIFNPDSKVKYIVPKYQREYAWRREQVEELLNDLLENQEGYFLGTMLCVNKTTDALEGGILEIIDGQQRLTTISLLMRVRLRNPSFHQPLSFDIRIASLAEINAI